jgi:NADPH2:quinone reductase
MSGDQGARATSTSQASALSGLELRSLVSAGGELELSLLEVAVPEPAPDEVVVRVEATPINPSDLSLLLAAADLSTAHADGTSERPIVRAAVPAQALSLLATRLNVPMPVGNEGAGVVIRAGAQANALVGKTVAVFGGAMWAQYRVINAADCQVLPPGTTPRDGASWYVNPLTALGMVETMRREGHTALAHTAAASNLGQMLNRICLKDGIGLVNIVRSAEQVALLRSMGAVHVCDSTSPDFMANLTEALAATGATLAFDAIGGGALAGQILTSMEAAVRRDATSYSHYGSDRHKQVYLYGRLNPGPTEIDRSPMGFAWGVGGWLLPSFLKTIGPEAEARLRDRVVAELTTTFASHYTAEISLTEALQLDVLRAYSKRTTGEKYLIVPNKG